MKSLKLKLEQSRLRQRLIELNKLDDLTDEQRAEMTTVTDRMEALEPELRAALTAEAAEAAEARSAPAGAAADPEARERADLRARARVHRYVGAALEQRAVDGVEAEYAAAVGSPGRFPLSLLAPEHRATTNVDGPVSALPWLDRLFADIAAARLGITFMPVDPGNSHALVTTAGASASQRGRGQAAADAAWTIGAHDLEPTRNAVRAVFSREDAYRLPGLEDALRRDLRMALAEGIDRAIFLGDSGANENGADITGLKTAASVTEETLTQAQKIVGVNTLNAFANLIDGVHATGFGDLRVVAAVGAFRLWEATLFHSNTELTVSGAMRQAGLSWTVRGDIDTETAANDFGAFVGLGRGIEGAGVAAIWSDAMLIVDPYSGAAKGEVALTMETLWAFKLPRPTNFARIKFVA